MLKVLSVPSAQLTPSDQKGSTLKQRNELLFIVTFLVVLVVLKLALSLFLWRNGFLEYDTDGFTRSVRAWDWHSGHTNLEVDAWLPLQFWINGSLMNFWPDLLHLPRLVNIVCSIGTTLNLFFIGRQLFGRLNGYATALLAAVFPWELLFGLSGMSESMTNFFVSFGLVFFLKWLKTDKVKTLPLVIASVGFLGATMLRYEAWFYSAVYAAIVLYVLWQCRTEVGTKTWVKVLLSLVPAFVFIFIWMGQSWLELSSPFGFAEKTSNINHNIYGAANENASFLYRLLFYPKTFLTLFWPLTLSALVGSVLLVLRPVKNSWFYLAFVWGEFALFILTTLPYNNIAPGSARYPVSNLLLLLPVVSYAFLGFAYQPRQIFRLLGIAGLLILVLWSIQNATTRYTFFPNNNLRQVAALLNERWKDGYIKPGEKVYLILPPVDGPQRQDFTETYYALQVLTNHPDSFGVESNPSLFTEALSRQNGNAPRIWVYITSANGSIDNNRNVDYAEIKKFGNYRVGDYPYFGLATVQPSPNTSIHQFDIRAEEYGVYETTSIWVTRPDGKIIPIGNRPADAKGVVSFSYTISETDFMPGKWSIVIAGMQAGRRTSTAFEVVATKQ